MTTTVTVQAAAWQVEVTQKTEGSDDVVTLLDKGHVASFYVHGGTDILIHEIPNEAERTGPVGLDGPTGPVGLDGPTGLDDTPPAA